MIEKPLSTSYNQQMQPPEPFDWIGEPPIICDDLDGPPATPEQRARILAWYNQLDLNRIQAALPDQSQALTSP